MSIVSDAIKLLTHEEHRDCHKCPYGPYRDEKYKPADKCKDFEPKEKIPKEK